MTFAIWTAIAVLAVGLGLLALVVAGAIHTLDRLSSELAAIDSAPDSSEQLGPLTGSPAPPFLATRRDGSEMSSDQLLGRTHALLFAHPGCRPCEEVVTEIAEGRSLGVPLVLIARDLPDRLSHAWESLADFDAQGVDLVVEGDREISTRFNATVTPYAVVVGPEGRVSAHGVINNLEDIGGLLAPPAERGGTSGHPR
jgi:hypothetical protein